MADVVFPLETHAEKDGTVTHPEGRLQRVRPSASRPGDIRPNWGVLAELSLALGHDTGVSSQPTAFAALAEAVPFYAGITDAEIGGRGVRWQDVAAARQRGSRAGWRRRHPSLESSFRARRVRRVGTGSGSGARAGARDVPGPLGRADHRAQSAVAVPGARAAGRDLGGDAERLG